GSMPCGCRRNCRGSIVAIIGWRNLPYVRTAFWKPGSKRRGAGTAKAPGGWWNRQRNGVFMGTSTAGILQTELAYRERDRVTGALPPSFEYGTTHNSFSVADYLRQRLR